MALVAEAGAEGGETAKANTGGGDGFADVWLKGHFGWEYKGKRKNLATAYQQLLQYREDLENPPLLIVCDLDRWLNPPDASEAELKKRTLTNLYNERPTWLDIAHRKLDEAVLDAYGWPRDLSDEEILKRLLALNLERASAGEEVMSI